MNVVFFEVVMVDGVLVVAGRWNQPPVCALEGYEFSVARRVTRGGEVDREAQPKRGATLRWQLVRGLLSQAGRARK